MFKYNNIDKLYNTTSTCHLNSDYDSLVKPVGQIVEIGERRELKHRFCSGFNILEGQYFLTAGHCVTSKYYQPICYNFDNISPLTQGSCVVNYDYQLCGLGVWDTRLDNVQFLADGHYATINGIIDHGYCHGSQYDYGVLKLSPNSGFFGSLSLSSEVLNKGKPIMLVHHPEGFPKQYSTGTITHIHNGRIYHSAHTMGGSSGAPAISLNSYGAIGVHVAGDEASQAVNNAVPIRDIVVEAHQTNQTWVQPYLNKFGLFANSSPFENKKTESLTIVPYRNPSSCCY